MRGGNHLRAIRKDEEHAREPVATERSVVRNELLPEHNAISSLLRDIERTMFESFWIPLRGMGSHPLREFFNETSRLVTTPAVDMFEREGNLVVRADMPGLAKDDISVRVVDHNLEITGERKTEENVSRKDYMKLERTYGSFRRVLRLPENVDGDKVEATFKDGVLELLVPLRDITDNSRKIEIK